MVVCSVLNCKNSSHSVGRQKGNISFYRFPKDPKIKEKWIDATGNPNRFPTKHSTICSIHFHDSCFTPAKKYRRLENTAYPTISILMSSKARYSLHLDEDLIDNNDTSKKRKLEDINQPSTSDGADESLSTPKKRKLLRKLSITQDTIKKQNKKIKRLTEQNRRRVQKIHTLLTIIECLKKNTLVSDEQAESLKTLNVTTKELNSRQLKNAAIQNE